MIPKVTISIVNGQLGGVIATNDGVTGVVLTGAGTGTVALLTPKKVSSLEDGKAQGFTQAAEPEAYRFLLEFYSIDGTLGVPVYLMLVANTASMIDLVDKTSANGINKLIAFANGTIRVIAVARKPANAYVPTLAAFIDSDVTGALSNAQAFTADAFARHQPVRIILAARVFDETNATVFVPNTQAKNGVALAIGGTQPDGSVSLGLILGRVAASPVHRNIGRVKDGALLVDALFIGSKPVEAYANLNGLIDSGFITFTTYPQKAGYFISDDPMATSAADDYNSLANCRVIDKASIITYQTYLEELKDDVELDENGNIDPVDLKYLEGTISNNITNGMGSSISGEPKIFIDPAQNLLAGSTFKVKERLQPKGYLKAIDVELGFINPSISI